MPCPRTKQCPVASLPYIVRQGDTLYKIAQSYSTSVEAILHANVNLNIYNLNVGQTICIPLPDEQYPACRTTNYYIAQEGDTFFSIGQKFGVDTEEIINANMGVLPENIYTGIILCIPVAPSPVCMSLSSDGSRISVINQKTGNTKNYESMLSSSSELIPGNIVLTQKRLEAGDVEGAKELLFSPYEFGIRGQAQMNDSRGLFVITDDNSMLEIFNSCPVGTILEVEGK
ncbi:MAG: LysM peptidoglycan-binding domain-containing protein [Clostridia bacterium]|nr:LysM peptidoglycan-binding domain-containing protein [Clostridia bacterium]